MRHVIAVLAVVWLASGSARADDATRRADALFVEGRDHLKKGDAKAACEKFHAANALAPAAPGVMYNLGLCYEALGKLATSLKWYRKAQTAAGEAKPPATEFEAGAAERQRDLAAKVARVTVGGETAGVAVLIDGTRIDPNELATGVEVDAGAHTIEAEAPGKTTHREQIEVQDGQSKNIAIPALVDAPKPVKAAGPRDNSRLGKIMLWTGGALVVAIPVPAIVIWQRAKDRGEDYSDSERLQMRIMGGVWIAGLVAAGVGTYFVVTRPKNERATALVPVVTPDSVGVSLGGRF